MFPLRNPIFKNLTGAYMFGRKSTLLLAQRIAQAVVGHRLRRTIQFAGVTLAAVWLSSCAGVVSTRTAQSPIAVVFTTSSASVQVSQSQSFTVAVQNDSSNSGVTWSLSGSGCAGAACGTLANIAATSVTYRAPATVPTPPTVTLTATSVADSSKSASAIITITAAPPIVVSISPASTSVQVSTSANFTASVQNDSQNKGVTWSLSGAGCSGAACGTLTSVTTTSATYTAPAAVPTPATVALTATSVADGTKSNTATITISAAPAPISVSISPTSASLPVTTQQQFAATVVNDSSNQGVSWQVNGVTGGTPTFGTISTGGLYTAPASVPTPATFNATAVSKADPTKTASASVTITVPAPSITSLNPTSGLVGASVTITGANFGATQGTSTVQFNGTAATPTSWSATSIVAPVPTGATTGNVVVTVGGVASNGVSFTVLLPIAVTVSPSSASVQVSTAANFTASVQNDLQNKGVSWSVSGPGCSGAACGTLSNVTNTSVTYTAPASVPSPATVTITATSVTDSTKNALATITVTQPPGGGQIPGFAANHVSVSNTQGYGVSEYDLRLPNATMSGNCVIVGFQYSATAGATASVSDDKGNSYSTPLSNSDGNQIVNLSYALNVKAGAQKISITFSGGTPAYVSALATEFYNIATSSALDGSSGNAGTGTSVTAGSFTPSTSGDLIYQYAVQDSSSNPMTSWSQGASPWVLLSSDILDGSAAQYQVQTTAAAINPTMGMAPSQNFNSVAIALKAANAGSAPPSGIRVARVQHHSIQDASSTVHMQFPCTGNLIVLAWIGAPGHDITGVTDENNNAYVSQGSAYGYGLSGDSQIYYVANAATSTTMTGPTITTTNTDSAGSTAVMFDVIGAATSPYDLLEEASGSQSSAGNVTAVTISPSTANGLVITTIGVDSNTINGLATGTPGNFLSAIPTPMTGENPVDENNGWALWYNPSAAAGTFVWTTEGGAVNGWASVAVAFKAAP